MNLLKKTQEYISAFDQKDLIRVRSMLCSDVVLFDPANPNGLYGINDVTKMIENLFNEIKNLSFKAENIFCEKENTIIEFSLKIDDKTLKGVDIIEWNGGKIKELRAYLY